MDDHLSPPKAALRRAIEAAGGQTQLADLIGTTQSQVSYWLTKAKRGAAPEFVRKIEAITAVPAHELRPDVFPASAETAA